MITGPTTGALETVVGNLRVDDLDVEIASKGSEVTFELGAESSKKIIKWHRKIMFSNWINTFRLVNEVSTIPILEELHT